MVRRWGKLGEREIDHNVVFWLKLGLTMLVAIIMARGVFLTVVMGSYYQQLATDNRIKREAIEAKRGVIVDRGGKVVALNVDEMGKPVRFYPLGEIVAPVVGYLSKASEDDLKKCSECLGNVWVGKDGLEKQYQKELMGKAGERVLEETAQGEYLREISRVEPTAGKDLKLNLDIEGQKVAYWALKRGMEKTGAKSGVVLVTKVSGEVLSLVSLPSFDPNLFIGADKRGEAGGDYASVEKLLSDTDKLPLFNRAIAGAFAPGSVFKPLVAAAGLMEGKIDRETLIEDTGEIVVGQSRFGNWLFDKSGGTEGKINVERALARSNDIFFYRLGEKIGVELLDTWAGRLGIGQKTNIDLPGEVAGLLPTPLWREKELGERWYLGNTYHMSIGQGELLVTPMQMNRATAAVVSGIKCEPKLVGLGKCEDSKVSKQVREIIIEGMKQACMRGGTGVPFFNLNGQVWCKTGTAQQGGEKDKPHAWISVIIPKGDDSRNWLVVTVMMQEAGEGSTDAGPVAREVVDFWLKDKN